MHRDQKIGLSLAVLLIGFAGAFCFRHEPVAPPQTAALEHADEIDLRIEHLPIRAYTEREGVRLPGTSPPKMQEVVADGSLSDVLVAPLPGFADDPDQIELFAGPPEPLRVYDPPPPTVRRRVMAPPAVELPRPPAVSPKLSRNDLPPPPNEYSVADAKPPVVEGDSSSQGSSPTIRTYVVQPGDTLSGIAERYLGSMVRYHELFEANRDVLADPNSLRSGVVLKIPEVSKVNESH